MKIGHGIPQPAGNTRAPEYFGSDPVSIREGNGGGWFRKSSCLGNSSVEAMFPIGTKWSCTPKKVWFFIVEESLNFGFLGIPLFLIKLARVG